MRMRCCSHSCIEDEKNVHKTEDSGPPDFAPSQRRKKPLCKSCFDRAKARARKARAKKRERRSLSPVLYDSPSRIWRGFDPQTRELYHAWFNHAYALGESRGWSNAQKCAYKGRLKAILGWCRPLDLLSDLYLNQLRWHHSCTSFARHPDEGVGELPYLLVE